MKYQITVNDRDNMSYKMRKLVQDILTRNKMTFDDLKEAGAIKVKNDGFMDLNVDYLRHECKMDTYAVSHYYTQQGDSMADPDMEFFHFGSDFDRTDKFNVFYPSTFQQDGFPQKYERTVECEDGQIAKPLGLKKAQDLVTFANRWATNLRQQGFVKGECTINGKPCKTFNPL